MERMAMVELARTMAQRDSVKKQLDSLKKEMESAGNWWRQLRGEKKEISELLWMRHLWNHLSGEAKRCELLLEEWEEKVAEAHQKWLRARRDKRVMEKLRDRALAHHFQRLNRAEIQSMDEASMRTHAAEEILQPHSNHKGSRR